MNTDCKVLIVDDEMLVRQGIKHLFNWELEGFTIAGEASNGKEALELISRLKPHIVIMDVVMPVMDGEELARQIKEHYADIKIIVLSSFSEFEYVRSTFQSGASDYILKPKLDAGELLAILKKTAASIPALQKGLSTGSKERTLDALLDKLLAGYQLEDAAAEEQLAAAFPYPAYLVLAAEPCSSGKRTIPAQQTAAGLAASLTARLAAPARDNGLALVIHSLQFIGDRDTDRKLLLLNTELPTAALLPGLAARLAEENAGEEGGAVIALSRVFTHLSELYATVSEQIPALLEKRFFMPEQQVFDAGELQRLPGGTRFDSGAFAEELNNQQFFAAFEQLRAYTASMAGRADVGMYEFKSFLGHSLFTIILALLRCHYDAGRLDSRKYDIFRSIHGTRDIREARQILEQFLSVAEEIVMERSRSAGGKALQDILAYIREHYASPLTLSEVAQHFHFNPSYLSNYFATHNQEGFSEYLSRIRVEKACELLRREDTSIADIGSLVGYADQSYFTKVFRKQMGVSPSQYRKKLAEGHDPL